MASSEAARDGAARHGAARLGLALCGALVLSGCETGPLAGLTQPRAGSAEAVGVAPGSVVEQDEEAPDVFQATERGLWDGRPSLGGVWVAHPDVREPQRVVIRNTANGKSTIGALFRRDGEAPGPRILISSDAAATLEILAGQPTDLSVVALVRREIEVAPPPGTDAGAAPAPDAASPDTAAEGTTQTAASDAAPADDAAAIAAAALAATGAAAGAATDAVLADPSVAAPEAPAPRRGLFGFLRRGGSGSAPASADAAAPGAPATDPASTGTIDAETLAPAAVETQSLDAPAATAAAAAPAPAGGPDRPFVQAGLFSVEANATEAADRLRAAGIIPDIRQSQSGERTIWRVLAGPAASRADLDALLNSVKALGFADAYFVRG